MQRAEPHAVVLCYYSAAECSSLDMTIFCSQEYLLRLYRDILLFDNLHENFTEIILHDSKHLSAGH